ncbi:Chromosome transmission fidelity protein 18 [Metarhizium acridum]|nr:Chromosome transmission fidelity protein 18 [Metarhizium acridum]
MTGYISTTLSITSVREPGMGTGPYLSQPILACHHLFASPKKHYTVANGFEKTPEAGWKQKKDNGPPVPFSGPRADFQAAEAEKQNRSQLQGSCNQQLSPTLMRSFRSAEDVATEFLTLPHTPCIPGCEARRGRRQPGVHGERPQGERKVMVQRASEVLAEVGIALHKGKVEGEMTGGRGPQYVYRMEPDLDSLSTFEQP